MAGSLPKARRRGGKEAHACNKEQQVRRGRFPPRASWARRGPGGILLLYIRNLRSCTPPSFESISSGPHQGNRLPQDEEKRRRNPSRLQAALRGRAREARGSEPHFVWVFQRGRMRAPGRILMAGPRPALNHAGGSSGERILSRRPSLNAKNIAPHHGLRIGSTARIPHSALTKSETPLRASTKKRADVHEPAPNLRPKPDAHTEKQPLEQIRETFPVL